MPSVGMNDCRPALVEQDLRTSGLDTCIAVCAYGLPGPTGVNKVIAHASTGSVDYIIGSRFIAEVQASGMTVYGVCVSKPDPTRNDHLSDSQVKDMMEELGYERHSITKEHIKAHKKGMKALLKTANDNAVAYCQQLGASVMTVKRDNADVARSSPYGTMTASASPGGKVKAEGQKMADIPDVPRGNTGEDSRRGGHSGSSGSNHRSGGSTNDAYYRSSGSSSHHKSSGGSSSSHHKSSRSGRSS
jgi:hypothetical protein